MLTYGIQSAREVRRIVRFLCQTARLAKSPRTITLCASALRDLPTWIKLGASATPIDCELPWLTFGALKRLEAHIRPSMRVFEYGAGGSTLYFARKGCRVSSVEHDEPWHAKVQSKLHGELSQIVDLRLERPIRSSQTNSSMPRAYRSSYAEAYKEFSFEHYARAIDDYADDTFDIVLVDGRARVDCVRHAIKKLRYNGILILDDSERARYEDAITLLQQSGFNVSHFYGPGPFIDVFWRTSIAARH